MLNSLKRPTAVLAGALWLAGAVAGAQTPAVDLDRVGPAVGDQAPAFTLSDQNGRQRSLESILGERGAMLVFFRSADW